MTWWYNEAHTPDKKIFTGVWAVEADWAHPAWSQYLVFLYDLKPHPTRDAIHMYMKGATHEISVWVVDPDKPLQDGQDLFPIDGSQLLTPQNHGYQFKADSNEAAVARIQTLVDLIEEKKLSPDTDFRQVWDWHFRDGVSLKESPESAMHDKQGKPVH